MKVDITQAPLKPWLEASERPGSAKLSLFASLVPGAEHSDLPPTLHPAPNGGVGPILELLKDGIPDTRISIDQVRDPRAKTTVGRRAPKFEPGYGPVSVASKALGRCPRWLWFAAPAGIALGSAVLASLLSGASNQEHDALPATHSAETAAPAPRPLATTAPVTPPNTAPPLAAFVPAPSTTNPAPSVTAVPKPVKAARRAAPRPAAHRAPSRAELKNPFQ